MTKEQQDAAWRSLPEDFKRHLRCDYTTAESAHSLDPTNVRIDVHKKFLEKYFGKYNLTATKDEKLRLDFGDKAKVCAGFNRDGIKDGDIVTLLGYDSALGGYNAVLNPIIGTTIPNKHLAPYTEEQEQVDGRQEVVDMTLKTWLNSTPDWLAYRMELAKEVVKKTAFRDETPKDIVDATMTIVDGIVKRLKGGLK